MANSYFVMLRFITSLYFRYYLFHRNIWLVANSNKCICSGGTIGAYTIEWESNTFSRNRNSTMRSYGTLRRNYIKFLLPTPDGYQDSYGTNLNKSEYLKIITTRYLFYNYNQYYFRVKAYELTV
jgi:hypothetical protein